MKKILVLGIVLLLSIVVQAGDFDDFDNDGVCESNKCNKLDLCPKWRCDQIGADPRICSENRNEEPCPVTERRRKTFGSGGGGGGGDAQICGSCNNFATVPMKVNADCCGATPQQLTAVCNALDDLMARTGALPQQCTLLSTPPTPAASIPTEIVEMELIGEQSSPPPKAAAKSRRTRSAPKSQMPSYEIEQPSQGSGWAIILALAAVIAALAIAFWPKKK